MQHSYLVTGGTGSFGSKCVEALLKREDTLSVRVYSRNEHKQQELADKLNGGDIAANKMRCFIGDVCDKERLKIAMRGCDIVIHAAALKSVPIAEYNPMECVKTNIYGTSSLIESAIANGVHKLIALSSDKAVSPINLYGATKLVMEKLITNANIYRGNVALTKFCCVRYGNVCGSNSSVIQRWRKEIELGKPVTVTDMKASRFWITIDQAVKFVIDSIDMMDDWSGGEIFVPKLPSVRILDLYNAIRTGVPIGYNETGLRPSEKMHECLLMAEERKRTVDLGDRYVVTPESPQWPYSIPKNFSLQNFNGAKPYTSDDNNTLSISGILETLG